MATVLLELSSSPYTKASLQDKVKAALADEVEEVTQSLVSPIKINLPTNKVSVVLANMHILIKSMKSTIVISPSRT